MPNLDDLPIKKSLGSLSVRKGFSQIPEELLAAAMEWNISRMTPATQLEIVSEYISHLAQRTEKVHE